MTVQHMTRPHGRVPGFNSARVRSSLLPLESPPAGGPASSWALTTQHLDVLVFFPLESDKESKAICRPIVQFRIPLPFPASPS